MTTLGLAAKIREELVTRFAEEKVVAVLGGFTQEKHDTVNFNVQLQDGAFSVEVKRYG